MNRIIRLHGDQLGIENPGQIYHVRARQDESRPPEQECLQRTIGNWSHWQTRQEQEGDES